MPSPKVLLFDLGGVLVDFAGLRELPDLLEEALPLDEMRRRWLASPAILAFERGRITADDFARQFLAEWRLGLEPEAFIALFRSWNRAPLEGAHELLARLRPRHRLACLSNTNELHWEDILDGHGLRPCFDHHYASHLLRLAKPDPEIFTHVAADLGHPPADIVFFDDGLENVESARATGMQAHRVEGITELTARLVELDLLEPA